MRGYSVSVDDAKMIEEVFRITAYAAKERGDALHVATEEDEPLISKFFEDGKGLLEKALGRYSMGGMSYSMPENWKDRSADVNENAAVFLKNYALARWYELNGTGERFLTAANEALEVIVALLNKRDKPI